MVTLHYGADHEWYKCPRCSGIFPYTVWGKCAHCGKGELRLMNDDDFKGIDFWRSPVLRAVNGDPQALMTRINTEESLLNYLIKIREIIHGTQPKILKCGFKMYM